jgi:hypothetical protein
MDDYIHRTMAGKLNLTRTLFNLFAQRPKQYENILHDAIIHGSGGKFVPNHKQVRAALARLKAKGYIQRYTAGLSLWVTTPLFPLKYGGPPIFATPHSYRFEWRHGSKASLITMMYLVLTDDDGQDNEIPLITWDKRPRVVVERMATETATLRISGIPLVHFPAVVAEIAKERARLFGKCPNCGQEHPPCYCGKPIICPSEEPGIPFGECPDCWEEVQHLYP